jgi:hypothetical protein
MSFSRAVARASSAQADRLAAGTAGATRRRRPAARPFL